MNPAHAGSSAPDPTRTRPAPNPTHARPAPVNGRDLLPRIQTSPLEIAAFQAAHAINNMGYCSRLASNGARRSERIDRIAAIIMRELKGLPA